MQLFNRTFFIRGGLIRDKECENLMGLPILPT